MLIDDGFVQIPTIAAASVASPPAGSVKLFFDSSNANRLSQKDSAGAVIDLAASGGGGGASLANVTITPAKYGQADVPVTDAAVTPASRIMAWLLPNDDWDADDLLDLEVCPTAGSGSVIFTVSRAGPIVGNLLIAYQII